MSAQTSALLAALTAPFLPDPPARLGVAVSGGGDSLALLLILAEWARDAGVTLHAATVDHGLRPEAAGEAAMVAALCASHGIPHDTLRWTGWDGAGNLQDQARRARYRLLSDWARGAGLPQVALGHTADDQAETLLMRLARGAGVDGLTAIPERREIGGVIFVRPALGLRRADLRDYLRGRGQAWVDDPSNDDAGYDRIKARQALALLAPLGVTVGALAQVAGNMALVRAALDWHAGQAAAQAMALEAGDVLIDPRAFAALPEETARRLLLAAIGWIGGAEYAPRRKPLMEMLARLRGGDPSAASGLTLNGCLLLAERDRMRLTREYRAVQDLRAPVGQIWDGRWRLTGAEAASSLEVAALGEAGLALCPDWRATARPRAALLATPAVWDGPRLIAAPLAGMALGWRADPLKPAGNLLAGAARAGFRIEVNRLLPILGTWPVVSRGRPRDLWEICLGQREKHRFLGRSVPSDTGPVQPVQRIGKHSAKPDHRLFRIRPGG